MYMSKAKMRLLSGLNAIDMWPKQTMAKHRHRRSSAQLCVEQKEDIKERLSISLWS